MEIEKFSIRSSGCGALPSQIWRQKVANRYQDSNENIMHNEHLKACVLFMDAEISRAKLFRGRPPDLIAGTIKNSCNLKAQSPIPTHLHPKDPQDSSCTSLYNRDIHENGNMEADNNPNSKEVPFSHLPILLALFFDFLSASLFLKLLLSLIPCYAKKR
ncbi:uncharacterized protein LOC103724200 [Phoenix dactylifera]|uniref:Uncharacterized protein LOC103724200 n=1 Tax=Phoenix dactylifera TaxID=42345 RepID=A0A8B9ASP9_PHODC|nr:uncharacterized protein LOC103724200 [Phoenix dactylifera]